MHSKLSDSRKMRSDDAIIGIFAESLARDVRMSNEWRAICEVDAELKHEEKDR